jgi:hypothetical protein
MILDGLVILKVVLLKMGRELFRGCTAKKYLTKEIVTMSELNKSLLQQCAEKIKRWPRLNATHFPDLPAGCNFVVIGLGGHKLEIHGRIFDNDMVNKEKKRIKLENKGE